MDRQAQDVRGAVAYDTRGVLKIKLGYNPNSSSIGTDIVVFFTSAAAAAAVFNAVVALVASRTPPPPTADTPSVHE